MEKNTFAEMDIPVQQIKITNIFVLERLFTISPVHIVTGLLAFHFEHTHFSGETLREPVRVPPAPHSEHTEGVLQTEGCILPGEMEGMGGRGVVWEGLFMELYADCVPL